MANGTLQEGRRTGIVMDLARKGYREDGRTRCRTRHDGREVPPQRRRMRRRRSTSRSISLSSINNSLGMVLSPQSSQVFGIQQTQ